MQIQLLWKQESSAPLRYYVFPSFLVRFVEKVEYANNALSFVPLEALCEQSNTFCLNSIIPM